MNYKLTLEIGHSFNPNRSRQVKLLILILLSLLLVFACKRDTDHQRSNTNVQWVNANQLHPGPVRHERLTNTQIERIKKVQLVFAEVDNSSIDKWIEDFKRDADPDNEIASWERMAAAYSNYVRGKDLPPEAKQDVFQIVLLRSGASEVEMLRHLKLKVLTEEDAKKIIAGY